MIIENRVLSQTQAYIFWAFQYEKCEFILRKVSLDGNDPSWCFLSTHSGKRSDARKRFWVLINFLLTLRAAAHTSEPFLLRARAFTYFFGVRAALRSRKTLCSIQSLPVILQPPHPCNLTGRHRPALEFGKFFLLQHFCLRAHKIWMTFKAVYSSFK